MTRSRITVLVLAVIACCGKPMISPGQEGQQENQTPTNTQSAIREDLKASIVYPGQYQVQLDVQPRELTGELHVVPRVVEFANAQVQGLLVQPFPYASSDGQYAAQNADEIKVYEDLKMTYQFIEQPYLRKQLRLPDEQGLFVLDVDPAGQGHKNGFAAGDLILKVAEQPIDTQYDFVIAFAQKPEQEQVVELVRDGDPVALAVKFVPSQDDQSRYIIGVSVEEIGDLVKTQLNTTSGVSVSSISSGSPAEEAGLQVHDVVASIGGREINTLEDLRQIVQESKGASLDVAVIRAAKRMTIQVTPKQEEPQEAQSVTGHLVEHALIFDGAARSRTVASSALLESPSVVGDSVHKWLLFKADEPGQSVEAFPGNAEEGENKILQKLAELETKIDRLIESSK